MNSQTVVTTINGAAITSTKTNNKSYANVGDTIAYTIVIKNTGNATANNILFIDTIPSGTSLVANTFKQDTTNIAGTPNPPGVTLPNSLSGNSTTTITFQVKVDTIPSPNPIPNSASSSYVFTIDPSITDGNTSSSSTNIVNTQVNNASLANIQKSVSKAYTTCARFSNYR